MGEQQAQLERVDDAIGDAVMAFCEQVGVGGFFHAKDLHDYVKERIDGAPGSADRILRFKRETGLIAYRVENRRASLYQLTAIGERIMSAVRPFEAGDFVIPKPIHRIDEMERVLPSGRVTRTIPLGQGQWLFIEDATRPLATRPFLAGYFMRRP